MRENIVDLFRKVIFPYKGIVFKTKEEEESEENTLEKIKDDYNKFFKYIEDKSTGINYNLSEDYFSVPSAFAKELYKIKIKIQKISY